MPLNKRLNSSQKVDAEFFRFCASFAAEPLSSAALHMVDICWGEVMVASKSKAQPQLQIGIGTFAGRLLLSEICVASTGKVADRLA